MLDETFQLRLDGTDEDGDQLTYGVPNLPRGATFNSTENALVFNWNVESSEEVHHYRIFDIFIKL